jgi:protein-arginine kinase activator protein McsA
MARKCEMAFPTPSPRVSGHTGRSPHLPRHLPSEGEHHLEKLQFSLAVALSRGDHQRSAQLRRQIAELGEVHEEPGT